MIMGYSHSAMLHQFLFEFFSFILTVISSCYPDRKRKHARSQGGLNSPRENHVIVTSGSKGRDRLARLNKFMLQFFFTTKQNPKNGTGSVGFGIRKWTSLLVKQIIKPVGYLCTIFYRLLVIVQ